MVKEVLQVLQGQPSNEKLLEALVEVNQEIKSVSRAQQLEIIGTLHKYIVPVFMSLPKAVLAELNAVYRHSYSYISTLIHFIGVLDKKSQNVFRKFIIQLLRFDDLLLGYIVNTKSKMEYGMCKSLFFGSKIFNCLAGEIDPQEYIDLMLAQLVFWMEKNVEKELVKPFVQAFISYSPYASEILFDYFFSQKCTFDSLVSLNMGTEFTSKMFVYLSKVVNQENYAMFATLLQDFPVEIEDLMKIDNNYLKVAVIESLAASDYLSKLATHFTAAGWEDELVCNTIVILLHKMSDQEKATMSQNFVLLDGVTKRLSSEDSVIRERTMYIAKLLTCGKVKYESDFVIEVPKGLKKPVDWSMLLKTTSAVAVTRKTATMVQKFATIEVDSDDEDTVFLKDLVQLLNEDEKRLVPHLKTTIKLVRQKADFVFEVDFYSEELIKKICRLTNKNNEKEFEEAKINALVSVIVVCPEKIKTLYDQLFTGDYSLQQRMCILSVASLSARELRGLNDEAIVKPDFEFVTKRLPYDQKPVIEDVSFSSSGTVVRRSAKLDKKPTHTKPNKFSAIAHKFFYPLVNGWIEGIDIGSFTNLLKAHYIRTMQIIVQASYPAHQFQEMSMVCQQITEQAEFQGVPL